MNQKITYEQKKQEKLKEKELRKREQRKQEFKKKSKYYALLLVLIAGALLGIYTWMQAGEPEGEDFSRSVEIMGEEHISVGSTLPEYNSNPPTSGPHYGQTAAAGFRTEEIPDQHLIHNLEHGDVWISYKPDLSEEIKESLKQFDTGKVVITPRSKNDTDIAIAAWGRLDKFNLENDVLPVTRIEDFIKRYANKGPERVPGRSQGI